uniref:Uncharacterized protein n=1 Tax=Cacopsylla melanoneura TaxID=428564 RepID=A0A8D8TXT5_9HEMI
MGVTNQTPGNERAFHGCFILFIFIFCIFLRGHFNSTLSKLCQNFFQEQKLKILVLDPEDIYIPDSISDASRRPSTSFCKAKHSLLRLVCCSCCTNSSSTALLKRKDLTFG